MLFIEIIKYSPHLKSLHTRRSALNLNNTTNILIPRSLLYHAIIVCSAQVYWYNNRAYSENLSQLCVSFHLAKPQKPNIQNFFSLLHRPWRSFACKFLRLFRSISLSNYFDLSVSKISFFTLSNHRWRGLSLGRFFVGFLIKKFLIRYSYVRQTRSTYSKHFAFRINLISGLLYNIFRPLFFVSHVFNFDLEQAREFSVIFSYRRWVVYLCLRVLWTMPHRRESLSGVDREYTVSL